MSMFFSLPKKKSFGRIFQSDVYHSIPIMFFWPHVGDARVQAQDGPHTRGIWI